MWECFWMIYLEDLPNKLWPIQLHLHLMQCFSVFTPVVTRGKRTSKCKEGSAATRGGRSTDDLYNMFADYIMDLCHRPLKNV
jgi:hypothetical protein